MIFHFGLIGYPLGHSLSPDIHNAALKACDLQGEYTLFSSPPDDSDALKALLKRVRDGEISGLNVTIPHKQNVIPLLDELTPTSRAIGAVNTIFMQEGKLMGDNTDVPGFLVDLNRFLEMHQSSIVNHKSALILGAGGSARAVVYALAQDGCEIAITARRLEQAQELASHYSICAVDYNDIKPKTFNLLVNTTPVGMSPNIDASPWPANLSLLPNAAIYDLVYNPRETKLVKDARTAGYSATTSLGMLVEQAALSFEIWTGCNAPREPLFTAVEEL